MPNVLLIPQSDFLTCTVAASGENPAFPASNALVYARPGKEYRSPDTDETSLVLDFGASTEVAGLYLGEVNFEALVIEGNVEDSWEAPAFSLETTVNLDVLTQRRKGFFALTSFEYQYLRLVIEDQTRLDGAAFYRIGVILPTASANPLPHDPKRGYRYSARKASKRVEMESGAVETVVTGLKAKWRGVLDFDFDASDEPTVLSWNAEEPGSVFLFFENGGATEKAYLAKFEGDIEISWPQHNRVEVGQITLEEVV